MRRLLLQLVPGLVPGLAVGLVALVVARPRRRLLVDVQRAPISMLRPPHLAPCAPILAVAAGAAAPEAVMRATVGVARHQQDQQHMQHTLGTLLPSVDLHRGAAVLKPHPNPALEHTALSTYIMLPTVMQSPLSQHAEGSV